MVVGLLPGVLFLFIVNHEAQENRFLQPGRKIEKFY